MLTALTIRDFVIVDRVELACGAGFTVLTGETGAGKSILVDALLLALGERSDAAVVRPGCERAEVMAEFDFDAAAPLSAWLSENALEGDAGSILLRRVVDASGRSRAFVNGHSATLAQLRAAGEFLVDIHGQHAHQSLLRADARRDLLDGFAGAGILARDTGAGHRVWRQREKALREAEAHAAEREAARETLAFRLDSLDRLALKPGEWESLCAEQSRLAHAAGLIEGAGAAAMALSEGDGALTQELAAVRQRLNALLTHDPALAEIVGMLDGASVQVEEAARGLARYADRAEADPGRLVEVERRVAAAHDLARRFRVDPKELPDLLEQTRAEIAGLDAAGDATRLQQETAQARTDFENAARALSERRKEAAVRLSEGVTAAMQSLAMPGGAFSVSLDPLAEPSAQGREGVGFLVSAHPGQPLRELGRVASGGELSRISLAIQTVLSRAASVPTLIFDEVDVGIGGAVAEVVGRMLRELGRSRQVLCVTHLPQVAACGEIHWRVSKSAVDGGVRAEVTVLSGKTRIDEVARMLGGVEITDTTRKHAREMLGGNRL